MADRAVPLTARIVAIAILAAIFAPLAAVAVRSGGFAVSPADIAAVRFTLLQAGLSAAVSVVLAVPLARALARRQFAGREHLITLLGAPFLLPVIVAVFAILAIFGRAGVLNDALAAFGLGPVSVYGLQGVVLAHVFLNLPLATRMILQGWQSIPAERVMVAQSLGFSPADLGRHLERPMLRAVLPGAALVIFVICMTSFAVALTLGGGPRATTLELAIYQAVRFDFDLAHAAGLAVVQFVIGALAAFAMWRVTRDVGFGAGLDRRIVLSVPGRTRICLDGGVIVVSVLFLALPFVAVAVRGLPGMLDLPAQVWTASVRSVAMALVTVCVTMPLAVALAIGAARQAKGTALIEAAAILPLATSGLVLGTGLFVIVYPLVAPAMLAVPVTIGVNALLCLPFVYRLIVHDARAVAVDYGRLMDSLDLRGWAGLRLVTLPRLARPLGFGAGLTAALSMGDLGVIALFAGDGNATLPLVIQRLMGAYRSDAAAGAALLLVILSFALFWLFDRGGRHAAS